jgi:anti-sigma B factor antagonist
MTVQERENAGVHVVEVEGELDLATAPDLCARLDADRSRNLLVDLTKLEFCDSTGLRALLGAAAEVRLHGGRFGLVCPRTGDVARLLQIVGVGEWLAVHTDMQSGVAALAG